MYKMEQIEVLDVEIRRQILDEEIRAYANKVSQRIMIRFNEYGTSEDEWRESTLEEQDVIYKIMKGALANINYGRDIQATADAAEFIAMNFLRDVVQDADDARCNTYDTIYLPIKKWCREKLEAAERAD